MRTQATGEGEGEGDGAAHANAHDEVPASGSNARRLMGRTLSKAWDDGIFAMAAQSAYWSTLSLPPLLLGLLGSMGYLAGLFGQATLDAVEHGIIRFSGTIFSHEVVTQAIEPTVQDILRQGRPDIISIGFPIALFAGSSWISALVDSITFAHEQYSIRHPVWQRIFALLIYLVALVIMVVTLPLVALSPELLAKILPNSWTPTVLNLINTFYTPAVIVMIVLALTTLYKAALPRSLPWRRLLPGALLAMLVFAVSATGLRVYIAALTSTGYTYGALATPIALLLFAFLIGFAVVLGAQLNNAIQEIWPVRPSQRRHRIQTMLGIRALAIALGLSRPPHPARPSAGDRDDEAATGAAKESDSDSASSPASEPDAAPAPSAGASDSAASGADRAAGGSEPHPEPAAGEPERDGRRRAPRPLRRLVPPRASRRAHAANQEARLGYSPPSPPPGGSDS